MARMVPVLGCALMLWAAGARAQVPSTASQPAQSPVVALLGGQLTVQATNSSLRAILDQLQQRMGTKVEGLGADQRVYGVYGPGNPQEVLASLLDDSGYNVVIAGKQPDGAPREIDLSTRAAALPPPQTGAMTQAAESDDAGEDNPSPAQPVFMTPPPQPGRPAGGEPAQVRTPQQMLEELMRMRQAAQGQSASQ